MSIISWIILGLMAGAIAKALLPGRDPGGIIGTALIGIVGAFLGGWLSLKLPRPPHQHRLLRRPDVDSRHRRVARAADRLPPALRQLPRPPLTRSQRSGTTAWPGRAAGRPGVRRRAGGRPRRRRPAYGGDRRPAVGRRPAWSAETGHPQRHIQPPAAHAGLRPGRTRDTPSARRGKRTGTARRTRTGRRSPAPHPCRAAAVLRVAEAEHAAVADAQRDDRGAPTSPPCPGACPSSPRRRRSSPARCPARTRRPPASPYAAATPPRPNPPASPGTPRPARRSRRRPYARSGTAASAIPGTPSAPTSPRRRGSTRVPQRHGPRAPMPGTPPPAPAAAPRDSHPGTCTAPGATIAARPREQPVLRRRYPVRHHPARRPQRLTPGAHLPAPAAVPCAPDRPHSPAGPRPHRSPGGTGRTTSSGLRPIAVPQPARPAPRAPTCSAICPYDTVSPYGMASSGLPHPALEVRAPGPSAYAMSKSVQPPAKYAPSCRTIPSNAPARPVPSRPRRRRRPSGRAPRARPARCRRERPVPARPTSSSSPSGLTVVAYRVAATEARTARGCGNADSAGNAGSGAGGVRSRGSGVSGCAGDRPRSGCRRRRGGGGRSDAHGRGHLRLLSCEAESAPGRSPRPAVFRTSNPSSRIRGDGPSRTATAPPRRRARDSGDRPGHR